MIITNPRDVFSKIKLSDYHEILQCMPSIDADDLVAKYKDGNKCLDELKEQWINSLSNYPNYGVYNRAEYLNEVFLCWKTYSRRYLMLLDKWLDKEDCPMKRDEIGRVLDLGCGLALSTIGLKAIFPEAEVYGTNEGCSEQIKFDRLITSNFRDIHIVADNFGIEGQFDVVFASEFFEHIYSPLEFLDKIIVQYRPKYIVFANTFTQMAIGHFYKYSVNRSGIEVLGEDMPRAFTKVLKNWGYEKIQTKFYNNRPNIYVHTHEVRRLF